MKTAYGIPEFDTLGFGSELLVERLDALGEHEIADALVLHPGQGHVAVALAGQLPGAALTLVDRDLLALRVTAANLSAVRTSPAPSIHFALAYDWLREHGNVARFDVVVGGVHEKEGPAAVAMTIEAAVATLAEGGVIMLAGEAATINRIATQLHATKHLDITDRDHRRGQNVVVARRKR